MNIFAIILSALQTHYAGKVLGIVADFPMFLLQGLLTLLDDEKGIFAKALDKLLADRKQGIAWEPAFTDALNTFYSGEQSEGNKVAMAVLEWFAKTVEGL